MTALIRLRGVGKRFGGLAALSNLDLDIGAGQIVAIIGPNGAGKTTLFNLLSGFYRADTGRVFLAGRDVTSLPPHKLAELGISRTFQSVRLFPALTVLENVMVGCHVHERAGFIDAVLGTRRAKVEEQQTRRQALKLLSIFERRIAEEWLDRPAIQLSYADRRRVELARALAVDPKLMLLDEPTAGMNDAETEELMKLIIRIRDERGCAVLVVEHDMQLVRGVSDRVVVLDYGRKIAEGDFEVVARDPRVVEAYLGYQALAEEAVNGSDPRA